VPEAPNSLALTPHPLRAQVLAELHARPFTPVATPSRLLRFGFTTDAGAASAASTALIAFCEQRGITPPPPEARHFSTDLSEGRLRFERHNEFVTYTWEFPAGTDAFQPPGDVLGRAMALMPQPGPLIVAIDMHIVPADRAPDFAAAFSGANVVASEVEDERALIATDFLPDVHGFVRILIVDKQLTPISTGALAQRLLEIETYRTLALLGLPEAQRCLPIIERIDAQLPVLMRDVQDGSGFDTNRALLDRLTALAAEVEAQAAETSFRFGATRAYDELVALRIEAIKENHLPHHSTLASFLSRRMAPAMRTCVTVEKRLTDLSEKIARLAELLRTRVDIELESPAIAPNGRARAAAITLAANGRGAVDRGDHLLRRERLSFDFRRIACARLAGRADGRDRADAAVHFCGGRFHHLARSPSPPRRLSSSGM
jgi:uncharacterized membrane-anchored protein